MMRQTALTTIVAAAALAVITAITAAAPPPPPPRPQPAPAAGQAEADSAQPPLVTWWGPDSKVTERSIERITTIEQWADVWSRHGGAPVRRSNIGQPFLPEVDFDRCMVVVVFQGRGRNSNGLNATWEALEDQLRVRFDDRSYQTAGPGGGAVEVTAYGFFVIPRSDTTLVVEENVQNIIGAPPMWRERARFAAAEPRGA